MSTSSDIRVAELEAALGRVARASAPAVLTSSLSAEDMVLTDVILRLHLDIEVVTIDTGRLHGDTLELLDAIRRRYDHHVRVYSPDPAAIARYVSRRGRDAFYASPELRHECCHIRKVEPLRRALRGRKGWVTGLRREQSAARSVLPPHEFDDAYLVHKFNPLAEWLEGEVWEYLRSRSVPYNALYDQGYRSIGCAPCTRPVVAGEDARAGRWWWETGATKECGLHVRPDGRIVRAVEAA